MQYPKAGMRSALHNGILALVLTLASRVSAENDISFTQTDITGLVVTNARTEIIERRFDYRSDYLVSVWGEEAYSLATDACDALTPDIWNEEGGGFFSYASSSCPDSSVEQWAISREVHSFFDADLRAFSNQYDAVQLEWRYTVGNSEYDEDTGWQMAYANGVMSSLLNQGVMTQIDLAVSAAWGTPFSYEVFGYPALASYRQYEYAAPVIWGCRESHRTMPDPDEEESVGDPVNPQTGNMRRVEEDFRIECPGIPLEFTRTYDSSSSAQGYLGPGWRHSFDWHVATTNTVLPGRTNVWAVLTTGGSDMMWFRADAQGGYSAPIDTAWQLVHTNTGWEATTERKLVYGFDTNGVLETIRDAWGNTVALSYTNHGTARVIGSVRHNNGQNLEFTYQDNRLYRVSVCGSFPAMSFSYDTQGTLTNATRTVTSHALSTSYAYQFATNGAGWYGMTQKVDTAGTGYEWRYETNAVGQAAPRCVQTSVVGNTLGAMLQYDAAEPNSTSVKYQRDGTDAHYLLRYNPALGRITEKWGPEEPGFTNWSESGYGVRRYCDNAGNITNETITDQVAGEWLTKWRQYDERHHVTNLISGYCAEPSNAWIFTWRPDWDVVSSIVDPEGHQTGFDYTNGLLKKVRVILDGNQSLDTCFAYTTNGLPSSATNANGHWRNASYNALGFPTQTVSQSGSTNWMTWNVLGHLTALTLPSHLTDTNSPPNMIPRVITFDSNELGWVNKITYPDASFETFLFDGIGNLTNHIDTAGRTNSFAWLPTRKLASATRFLITGGSNQEARVSMAYDQQMNVLNIKDELNRAVEGYKLDLQDRPVSITNVEGQVMSLSWGVGTMLKGMARFDGSSLDFSYDEGARLRLAAFPDESLSFGYFRNGLLMAASNHWGIISNAFDGANRLTAQTQPVPAGHLAYTYHPAGQVSNVMSAAGTNTYTLDAGDRLQSIAVSGPDLRKDSFTYTYDSVNGLVSGMSASNGLKCAYTYDVMDRLTGISWFDASNSVLRSRSYTYTPAGLISNITFETGEKALYSYDSLDRLTREKHVDYYGQVISDERYDYDLAGNRTKKTLLDGAGDALLNANYSLTAGNRLASWTVAETNVATRFSVVGCSSDPIGVGIRYGTLWVSNSPSACVTPYVDSTTNFYAFDLICGMGTQYIHAAIRDLAGNTTYVTNRFYPTCLTNGNYQYSSAGCLTNRQYSGKDYTDNLGLTWNGQYQLTAASTNGTLAEAYGYDGAGRRIFIVEGGVTNWMVYDGNQVVAEVDGSGQLKKSYVYEGLDRTVSMTTYGDATNTYYFIRDHLGSTLALVDVSGNIVESYRYDAWGRVLGVYNAAGNQIDESAVGNRILWQGREFSFKTGLYYFRARWYDPVTGRWLSNDPIGISGGLNQYVFCGNNPVNFVDPYGLFQTGMFIRGLAGTVVSGVGAVVGAAAATTGVGTVPGGALALYSSYNFGANIGNIINSFRDVPAAPTGPIAGATVLATDSRAARNIAEAADLAIPFALSIGTSPVAWSRLPSVPVGPAGTLAGTLQRVPGDPSLIYPWIRGFQLGDAGLTAYDSWRWSWGGDVNSKTPCK